MNEKTEKQNTLIFNLKCAQYGMEVMLKTFPYGGLNRKDVSESLEENVLLEQVYYHSLLREEREKKSEDKNYMDWLVHKLNGVCCSEFAHFTKEAILEKYPTVAVDKVLLKRHVMLVIGREENSDQNDITTWGENAVILDTWARKAYAAKNFFHERECGQNIRFFERPGVKTDEVEEHYLLTLRSPLQ